MTTVLGVDSSTRSTKVEWRRVDDGELLGQGRAGHPPVGPGRCEQDPETWWQALVDAVTQLDLEGSHDPPAALSVAGQQHGMVVLDRHDEVVRPAKLWNDTESSPQADRLRDELGAEAWARRTGLVPVASFTISKVAWLAENEPEHAAAIHSLLLPHDWLTFRLTGRKTTDRGDASGTGYFDPAAGSWRSELLALADPSADAATWASRLPTVLGPSQTAGLLSKAAADALGLAPRIPVGPGTGDNMAAALAMALRPGDVAISLGTSGTVYAVTAAPVVDPSGTIAGFADASGNFLPLACTLNATQVTDTIGRLLGLDHAAMDSAALDEPLGASGLTLVPYLNGERTPNRPDATGLLAGITPDLSRGQLARAAFEGVVCGLLDALDGLADAGVSVGDGTLNLVGGGARSEAYRQILADLAGRPITIPADDELVARGACIQAAAAATGGDLMELSRRWQNGATAIVEPTVESAAGTLARTAYAQARDR